MRSRLFSLLVLAAMLFVAGCERSDTSPFTAEIDEPGYRRGKELIKQGRNQEALSEFQKVIDKRGLSNSPESHLEVGLLYQYHIKDPIAAIFHYRKFRELKPNSQQADLVRQRIDAATRDFAKTLPGQPLENQLDRLDMSDEMLRLQRENEKLKTDLAAARAGKAAADTAASSDADNNAAAVPETPATVASNDTTPVVRASLETEATPVAVTPSAPLRPAVAPTQTQTQQPQQPARYQTPPATTATTRPAASAPTTNNTAAATRQPSNSSTTPATTTARPPVGAYRRYTIAKGDTLFSLAQRYYGNRSRWRDIYAANRDVMKSEGDLRIGMEVRIPQ